MKIESSGPSVGGVSTADTRQRTAPSKPSESGDQVQLSSLSSTMQKAEAAIADTPVVDQQRVDEIRQAIAEGRFKVDANRIADGLIKDVRQMLDAQS